MKDIIDAFIFEDEIESLNTLHNMLGQYCPNIRVRSLASSVKKGLELLQDPKQQPELVFLDINLSDGLVFELLDQLPEIKFDIIFVSGNKEYADQEVLLQHLAFLHKPINPDLLIEAVSKIRPGNKQLPGILKEMARQRGGAPLEKLPLSTSEGTYLVPVTDIHYLFGETSYTKFYMNDGRHITISNNLGAYESALKNNTNFYRNHKNCMVNLLYVDLYGKKDNVGFITLKNGTVLEVSRRRWSGFEQAIRNFL